jgi:YlmC/YmxH family sporulation protein
MNLSDLQSKDVININDGKCIGNIIDVSIDNSGKTIVLLVEKYKFFISFFKDSVKEIKWNQISKIGKDVILVDIK